MLSTQRRRQRRIVTAVSPPVNSHSSVDAGYRRCTEDAIAARVQKPARTEEALRQQGVPEDEIKERRERYREYLRDHRGHFERVKPHFFAEDLCPSNATRFPLLFEDSADDLPLDHQSPESSPGTL